MATTVETLGNVIQFATSFTDSDGAPIVPATANLRINFVGDTYRKVANVVMANVGGVYKATWDSGAASARPGLVYWSAKGLTPNAAEDGEFDLTANPANQG